MTEFADRVADFHPRSAQTGDEASAIQKENETRLADAFPARA